MLPEFSNSKEETFCVHCTGGEGGLICHLNHLGGGGGGGGGVREREKNNDEMKSTKSANPRRILIPSMTPIMHARILATSRGVAVLRGQFLLLVCLGLDPLLEASKFLFGYAAISPARSSTINV